MWHEIIAMQSGICCVATMNGSVVYFVFGVFVSDERAESYHRLESPLIARRMLAEWREGGHPFLGTAGIARGNARNGLNLVITHFGADLTAPNALLTATNYEMGRRMFRGWNMRSFTAENFRHGRFDARSWGAALGYRVGTYSTSALDAVGISESEAPCVWMATREDAQDTPSVTLTLLFPLFRPPRCGFTAREQQGLLLALDGNTDEGIAQALGISNSTTKRLFRSIYEKAERALSMEAFTGISLEPGIRGVEIRRRLLNFVRQHPNELRPFDASAVGEIEVPARGGLIESEPVSVGRVMRPPISVEVV